MAKTDIEMRPGDVVRIPVGIRAHEILRRGKTILGNMRGPLQRRAAEQGVRLRRVRMTQDTERDCCVLMADVVEGDAPAADVAPAKEEENE